MGFLTRLFRKNSGTYKYANIPAENLIMGSFDRYTDPLIKNKAHNLTSPYDREEVAAQDPIANILTWGFNERAWSEMPKFYETDELGAPEVGLGARQLLVDLKIHNCAKVAWSLALIHGWSVTVFSTDENGELDYYIFSERECRPENVIRGPNNRVIGWRVYERPRLPLNRPVLSNFIQPKVIMRDQPGVVYFCLGDEKKSYGFGYSIFEHTWDSLTKLREESHANAFRARVFPISIVPGNWHKEQVEEYMKQVAKMDQMNTLVTKSGKNNDGSLVPELPAFNWISPGTSASNKSQSGMGGVFSNLSSEWVRLCGTVRRSIRYFTGNPGGALAAADVDQEQDVQADIEDFNKLRDWLNEFFKFIQEASDSALDLPDSFVIKSHWEWERDELMLQQQAMMEEEQQNEEPKENKRVDSTISAISTGVIEKRKKNSIPPTPNNSENVTKIRIPPATYKGDSQGLGWQPVNSQSGNVSRAAFVDPETIIIDFQGDLYEYSDKDRSITARGVTMQQVFDSIIREGGEAVWEYLRAPLAIRAKNIAGREADPQGYKKGKYRAPKGPNGPYTGEHHYATYKKTSKPTQPTGKPTALYSKAWSANSAYDPKYEKHPILQRYNSICAAAREMHKSKTTIYKMLDEVKENQRRINSMHYGNSFNINNPFVYETENGITVEYQDAESIKQLVGTSVPIWIEHRGPRHEEDFVGTYTINGFDEETGIEIAEYDIDWELVDQWFERNNEENWVRPLLEQGLYPDTSTEYLCAVRYNRERAKFYQSDFKLIGLALVKEGNCSGNYCTLK